MSDLDLLQQRNAPPRAGRLLTLRYIFALSSVAALSIGSQWLIQNRLLQGESDSNVINVAGRQRMLSQRLAKSAISLLFAGGDKLNRAQQELTETLKLWSTSQQDLQQGNQATGLPGDNSREIQQLFAAIQSPFERMQQAGQSLANLPRGVARLESLVRVVQNDEAEFLEGMDAIVSQYVVEAEAKVARLQRLERTILVLTLAVLLGEGLWIFRPAVNRIRQMVQQLDQSARKLQTAKEEAEKANAAKSRFLANVSHELRTPMTAVLGMTELASQTVDEEERQRYLQIVSESGNYLLSLLNDLIDVARLDRDQLELSPVDFSPLAVCEQVFRVLQLEAQDKNLKLITEDGTANPLKITADRRRIEQIVLNLASNALKYTERGTVTLSCCTKPSDKGRLEVIWSVADTGSGIAEVDMPKVFEPFTRLPGSTSQAPGGAGLGLSICRRLADALGASLELRSEIGKGTCATLRGVFPCAIPGEVIEPVPVFLAGDTTKQVLVVEDTRPNQILIERFLADAGHHVSLCDSGEEALEMYAEDQFDCVIIDLQLPGISGVETCARLRAYDRSIGRKHARFICLTADVGFVADGMSGTFDFVLTKPFERIALLTALQPSADKPLHEGNSCALTPNKDFDIDPSLYQELVTAYLSIEAEQRAQLGLALDEGRYSEAALLAHRIRGQVGYLSDTCLFNSLLQLEMACENKSEATATELAKEVTRGLKQLSNVLTRNNPLSCPI